MLKLIAQLGHDSHILQDVSRDAFGKAIGSLLDVHPLLDLQLPIASNREPSDLDCTAKTLTRAPPPLD